jgi:D-sedoheptulose 7-phosphate isomerase
MKPIDLNERRTKREPARRHDGSRPQPELERLVQSYLREMRESVDALPIDRIARVAEEMLKARAAGKTVYVLGNGGSAATAIHAVVDWRKPCHDNDRGAIRTVSLVDNAALLTAWANDTSFENVFAAQLEMLLTPGDLVIALSGSGNSPNVLNAVKVARRLGAITVGLLGSEGGALASLVDFSVDVPSDQPPIIEDLHMTMVHALRAALRHEATEDEGAAEADRMRAG